MRKLKAIPYLSIGVQIRQKVSDELIPKSILPLQPYLYIPLIYSHPEWLKWVKKQQKKLY